MIDRTEQVLKTFLKARKDVAQIEKATIPLQRHIRANIRLEEDLKRIEQNQPRFFTPVPSSTVLKSANSIYIPQKCDPHLANKIAKAAERVQLFDTVRHLTATQYLTSICNDALYGAHNLKQFSLPFRPAALQPCDITNGDKNAICMGANDIDPLANGPGTTEIVFDVNVISKDNPCAFFKQRDLGYTNNQIKSVPLGEDTLFFSHMEPCHVSKGCMGLQFFRNADGVADFSTMILNSYFISQNTSQMHSILTMNFFRFLDELHEENDLSAQYAEEIYEKISKLDDQSLVAFLENLGKQMTDTMEFNFYGAHKIDFSSVKTISSNYNQKNTYTLDLPLLIEQLNLGKVDCFIEAQTQFPELFASYRFIDYLLTTVIDESSQTILQQVRKSCQDPEWMDHEVQAEPFNL